MIVNNIDKAVLSIQSDLTPNVRKSIVIEYQEDDDNWIKYYMYYTRHGEIDIDTHNIKRMTTLEAVKEEMMAINEEFGEFDYLRVTDMEGYEREFAHVKIS